MKISINISKWTFLTILLLCILVVAGGIIYKFYLKPEVVSEIPTVQMEVPQPAASAQFQRQSAYQIPAALNYRPEFYNEDSPFPMHASFRPIGWSRNGKFAYVIEPADEACGCYFMTLYIQDLVTDKILWRLDYNSSNSQSQHPAQDLKSLWPQKEAEISKMLNFHEISQSTDFELRSVPIIQDNYQYDFPLRNSFMPDMGEGYTTIRNASIFMYRNGKSIIKIFNKDHGVVTNLSDGGSSSSALKNNIQGYLMSPFENRIAMIYSYMDRGYEGPPNVINLDIIGCNLNYKK